MRSFCRFTLALLTLLAGVNSARSVSAQSFGAELFNTLTPASGGMAGTSIARPQDNISAINGNAASLTQYQGTQFTVGGAWAGSTFDLTQTGSLPVGSPNPLITPFSAKSSTPGSALPNIGVTQDISALGLPVTFGLGVVSSAGGGTSFRLPQANGTNFSLLFLNFASSVGVQLTDRLSVGTTIFAGSGFVDGPFIGDSTMTNAYGIRGSVGVNYLLTEKTNVGFYYQTKQHYRFKDEVRLENPGGTFQLSQDLRLDLPDNIGFGISNSNLMGGKLLVAVDVLYIQWQGADLFQDIYKNQWVAQVGTQYSVNKRCKLRLGYAYAENPINPNVGTSLGGISPPGGFPAVSYLQAQFGVVNQHRISAGVGVTDVLPGLDFDTFAGGMFEASQQFGSFTNISVESYWIGMGFTWRFGRGDCAKGPSTSS
jgi:long-chain fatty acid transport protein